MCLPLVGLKAEPSACCACWRSSTRMAVVPWPVFFWCSSSAPELHHVGRNINTVGFWPQHHRPRLDRIWFSSPGRRCRSGPSRTPCSPRGLERRQLRRRACWLPIIPSLHPRIYARVTVEGLLGGPSVGPFRWARNLRPSIRWICRPWLVNYSAIV